MFNFFSFKKKQKGTADLNSLIIPRLDRIIELLEQNQKESPVKNIHFDSVKIEHLENIIFRLDNIDISELSGKLVIGNNISSIQDLGEPLVLKIDKEKAKKEAMSEASSPQQEQIIKTSKGFRFRHNG